MGFLAFPTAPLHQLLDAKTGVTIAQVKIGVEILGISFSPSCQHVAVGLSDGKVRTSMALMMIIMMELHAFFLIVSPQVFVYEIKRKLVGAGSCCSVA